MTDHARDVVNDLEGRLEDVARLVRSGDAKRAADDLSSVLQVIAALPPGPRAAWLGARGALERARLRWVGAGLEPSFTLEGAYEEALAATRALGELASPSLRVDLASTIAGIAYDLGDGASIERATLIVAATSASLLREGATREAAMLLDDEAALALRPGNVRKARELAMRSLALLAPHAVEGTGDDATRAALAETHHLLARLPLHGDSSDTTDQTLRAALEHADRAEQTYRALGMRRDLGRIRETTARLEARRGHVDAARVAFEAALALADESADLTGLARVTAGLAELLAATGNPRDALGLLARSIELNGEKGSPVGLAFDERALAQIEQIVLSEPDEQLAAELARIRERLIQAMAMELSAP